MVDRSDAIASNAAALFSSPHQLKLGNPHGDVTLVEFFDYGCGFCKRARPDMGTLIKDDPNLKIVLKELPILGVGLAEAAPVAVAVRMQGSWGREISCLPSATARRRRAGEQSEGARCGPRSGPRYNSARR